MCTLYIYNRVECYLKNNMDTHHAAKLFEGLNSKISLLKVALSQFYLIYSCNPFSKIHKKVCYINPPNSSMGLALGKS